MQVWRSPHDAQSSYHLGKKEALLGAIGLSLLAFLIQVAGAVYTGSLALLGDSAHVFTDLFSLVMSLAAVVIASRPANHHQSFGFYRLEVLASFVNGLLLLLVASMLAYEGVHRILNPEPVEARALVWIAVAGLVLNLVSALLLLRASREGGPTHGHAHGHCHDHGHGGDHDHLHQDRNLRSALLHVWSDALGSVAVIAGGIAMLLTGLWWLDPAIGLLLAAWILRWAVRVIWDAGQVLLESTPKHVKAEKLVSELRALDARVAGVDDLHVWEITSRMYAATAELRVSEMSLDEAELLRRRVHELLRESYGIAHAVIAVRPG